MSTEEIICAWKSEKYRSSLPPAVRAAMPSNPAGIVELSDEDLGAVSAAAEDPRGGGPTFWICITLIISNMVHCADSILHGTCGGFTVGCCS